MNRFNKRIRIVQLFAATLLLTTPHAFCSVPPTPYTSRFTTKLIESIPCFPAVLIQLVATYISHSTAILLIDTKDTSYQRCGTTFRMLVIGKNPKNPKLPLCQRFEVPWRQQSPEKLLAQQLVPCPESWYPEELTHDFTQLYREVMHHQNIRQYSMQEYIPIQDETDATVCARTPDITQETLNIFFYLSKLQTTQVRSDYPAIQAARLISLVYLAPGLTSRSLAQLQRNLYLYCTKHSSSFSNKRFPTGKAAYELNQLMNNYSKQKSSIDFMIAQQPVAPVESIFLNDGKLSSCIEHAHKRQEQRYTAQSFFSSQNS